MDSDSQLGQFLRARRELVGLADLGLPDTGRRRVPGLRREEVAMLAGVSTDYYVRLEQGRERHPSDAVLTALAGVLGLSEDALAHLRQLAAPRPRRRVQPRPERVSPGLLRLLGLWADTPALVLNRFRDVLACNTLAAALHPGLERDRNMVRLIFLDPAERELYPEWERVARDSVAWLRAAAGADLDDPRLARLVGELVVKSPEFARLWARHEVSVKSAGRKLLVHPVVGELSLNYETFLVSASQGQSLTVYHPAPGGRDADALVLLASHTATSAAAASGVISFPAHPERTRAAPAASADAARPTRPGHGANTLPADHRTAAGLDLPRSIPLPREAERRKPQPRPAAGACAGIAEGSGFTIIRHQEPAGPSGAISRYRPDGAALAAGKRAPA